MLNDYSINDEKANTGEANFQENIATWHPSGIVQNEPKDINDVLGGQPLSCETRVSSDCQTNLFPACWHNPHSEHLYQINPWAKELDMGFPWINRSWTSSLESYCYNALKTSCCLYYNGRRANFALQLNLLRYYRIQDVLTFRSEMDKLFAKLRRGKNIVAFAVFEVTRNKFKTAPTDKIHLHFLIDSKLTESELTELFHNACKAAKYTSSDYCISMVKNIAGISDAEYKYRYCNYIVKDDPNGKYRDKIILFKRNVGFRKVRTVGQWWVNEDGTPTTMGEIWDKYGIYMEEQHELFTDDKVQ